MVEIVYLQEKGRIPADLRTQLEKELLSGATGLVLVGLTPEVALEVSSIPREDVPDMPDRIIAATALHLGLPLISRDRKIRLSAVTTIW